MKKITFATAAFLLLSVAHGVAENNSGAYLASNAASSANDFQDASNFSLRILETDPANREAQENLLLAYLGQGDIEKAVEIAKQISDGGANWLIADLVILADDFAQSKYQAILDRYEAGKSINPLVDQLAKAWAWGGLGDFDASQAVFDKFANEQAFTDFANFQIGMMFLSQQEWDKARSAFAQVDPKQATIGERARILQSLIMAKQGDFDSALAFWNNNIPQPWNVELSTLHALLTDGKIPPAILPENFAQGSGEIFLSIASFVATDIDPIFTLVYARLAQYLNPNQELARLIGADMLYDLQQYDLSVSEFSTIPPQSPRFYSAELGRFESLNAMGDTAAGNEVLQNLIRLFPQEPFAYSALADVHRRNNDFEKALPLYDKAIEIYQTLGVDHWRMHYVRGITFERMDRWSEAERDFRTSLEINPDQPQVLNYLGYSMIEKGINLTQALGMIERAIEQSPESGYIVDSMAWGLFRLGRFQEAVPYMETAIELMPVDPIVNDHLGDVYWAVGRKLEARFQWRRALSFDPEPAEAERIRQKLAVGLDQVLLEEGRDPLHKTAQQ